LFRIRGPESGRFLRRNPSLRAKIAPEAITGCCQTGHQSSIFIATDELYRCPGVAFTQHVFLQCFSFETFCIERCWARVVPNEYADHASETGKNYKGIAAALVVTLAQFSAMKESGK
jgi:hypothetical protein